MSSLSSIIETMVLAIIISMVIIWLFFGDLKASMIVKAAHTRIHPAVSY